uniref:Uncharacterized protein n=1 Tax=Brassica campestris TaxID=3711 RepID=A0A3P5ZE02_BRACM|nr:unnamed protein product [Brassica rapa]
MYHARIIDTSLVVGNGLRRTLEQVKNAMHIKRVFLLSALGMTGSRRVEQDCKAAAKEVLTIVRDIQSGTFSL